MEEVIDPKRLMRELTVAELCATAEKYYAELSDPTHVLAKPFGNLLEAPALLPRIPLLLSGLRLGAAMVVLDFGAGSCWLSRLLNQLRCATISLDPSTTALEMGKRLFEISPIVGNYILPPRFLPFDGERIQLEDKAVDRIVCFDTFHHIPNQRQILSEFFRVLKPGGIVGFSEPGPTHSQGPAAQEEMRMHKVLENDIRLDEIMAIASEIGFSDLRIKLLLDPSLDLDLKEYMSILHSPPPFWPPPQKTRLRDDLWLAFRNRFGATESDRKAYSGYEPTLINKVLSNIASSMPGATVFFFTKGAYVADSRSGSGLQYEMAILSATREARVGQEMELTVRVKNVGQSVWLHTSIQNIGVVRVGVHLFTADHQLLVSDLAQAELGRDIAPGDSVTVACKVACRTPGDYVLAIALVSESVIWFETLGNKPQYLDIHVS